LTFAILKRNSYLLNHNLNINSSIGINETNNTNSSTQNNQENIFNGFKIIAGKINGKFLILQGPLITFPSTEQITFPEGRILKLLDPETNKEEVLIKDPIVIKAFPSHGGTLISILTKDLHLGILNLETKNFEVVFSDCFLLPSTDYINDVAIAWSLDDSKVYFSAHPKGWGTVFINDDADLWAYDVNLHSAKILKGSTTIDKYEKVKDEANNEYIITGVMYKVLGVLDTGEILAYYDQSSKVFKDGPTRDNEARIIAVSENGRERVLWKLFEKNAPVTEGEFAGLYPVAFNDNKLLAKKSVSGGLENLYLVEFKNGYPIGKKLLVSNLNSKIVAKFTLDGYIAYFNPASSYDVKNGFWTIIDLNGEKVKDLPVNTLPDTIP